MTDYYELDFLAVETKKSGDAIALRYQVGEKTTIQVVDGGFTQTGEALVEHIRTCYGNPTRVDHVLVTHGDRDHSLGVQSVLREFVVGALWMNRPWLYARELLPRFARFTTVAGLEQRLRDCYPNLVALEEIAEGRGIPIYEAFQGARIGAFTVMTPSRSRYLNLLVESDKTPDQTSEAAATLSFGGWLYEKAKALVRALWAEEKFSSQDTSAENEMSVVQYATLSGHRILLTGDTGRDGLNEAADHAPYVGLTLPGLDKFQVPHHGSRRNVSTETLDRWLGVRLGQPITDGQYRFKALISSAKEDEDHPRNAVVRAMHHRGGKVIATEGISFRTCGGSAPVRAGWEAPITPLPYPEEQEE